ncbi:thiamine-phosphate kinase [Sediminivirga luteola]|uniref:thiamine-phosphate kinase n=1 Tax=Sediminivirga luteola TaxID=1774748 RepID=UPI001F59C3B7|nr:thiamine-phosphate kinase [Sediminivirga luteola]
MTLRCADLGEDGLLARILPLVDPDRHLPGPERPSAEARGGVLLGPGDDAAVVRAPGDQVITTDMLVEGRDFHRDWGDGTALGIKAAAQNLADVAAMGARPTGLVVALGLPGDVPVAFVENLASGLAAEAARGGAAVIGGDLSGAGEITISVTAFGVLDGRPPVTRSGARPGDLVALAGTVGRAAAGLELLLAGYRPGVFRPADARLAGAEPHALDALIGAQLSPRPPYPSGPEAARAGARALIDASDGLVQDLGRIAAASGVRIEIDGSSPALRSLIAELLPAARLLGAVRPEDAAAEDTAPEAATPEERARRWLLGGGEDHGLLAVFPAAGTRERPSLPVGFQIVGRVLAAEDGEAQAGLVSLDGIPVDPHSGFSHFRQG